MQYSCIWCCDKDFNSKKIIRKSLKNYNKDLDLLLIDGVNHYILIKDINKFISNNSHVIKSCRNCLNSFIVKKNINFILNIVKTENLKSYYLVLKNICILKI